MVLFVFGEAPVATPVAGFSADFDPLPQAQQMGFRPTSGLRVQAHQDALRRQGLTSTVRGHHVEGNAYDFAPPAGMTQAQAIAAARQAWPGARVEATNGGSIHVTFPGWGRAQDVSGSRRRYGG